MVSFTVQLSNGGHRSTDCLVTFKIMPAKYTNIVSVSFIFFKSIKCLIQKSKEENISRVVSQLITPGTCL